MLTIFTKNQRGTIHEFPKPASLPVPPARSLTRLYSRPGFLLRRAHQISAAVFEEECRSVGLTPAQFGVLTVLRATPGLDQSSLARALGFDKVTVLRVLRGLEARGLVARSAVPQNRRNLSISLSDTGAALLKRAQTPAERAYRRLMAPLSAEQQALLVELLQQLTEGLEDDARAVFVPPDQT
ncbi:MarR family transcriptional regulator [Rhodoferax sediminis]|jgi:DNA-binding MarR family transcriptional regulator|uniref:MarR family transcriptional regulator n=1 Tax=Rhodoferax sediminis TaxID=2509614 RepID=A0A515DC39_9BURK|nr:MarR family transcriptional regulator [Rhodoferax sediminis]